MAAGCSKAPAASDAAVSHGDTLSATDGALRDGPGFDAMKECPPATTPIEQYHLPVVAPPAAVGFLTDWTKNATSGGWYGEQVMDACRMHPDGNVTWHGQAAVRVEVDPGDDPLVLGENSERAEMAFIQDANGNQVNEEVVAGTQFYATSYWFPPTWGGTQYPYSDIEAHDSIDCSTGDQTQCNSWSYVFQFHTGTAYWGSLGAAARKTGGPQQFWLTLGGNYELSDGGAIPLGHWTDLVLQIDWGTGAIAMWRRDEGATAFTQVVSATEPSVTTVTGVYMKQGLYRGGYVKGRSDVFWVGPTARATSFAAAELAAFGTVDERSEAMGGGGHTGFAGGAGGNAPRGVAGP